MKKQLLTILSVAVSLAATAQNKKIAFVNQKADQYINTMLIKEPAVSKTTAVSTNKNGGGNTPNASILLAQGPNAFGMSGDARSIIWADPSINTISFIHRNAPGQTGVGISGDLNSDFSTDGGVTWTINHPIFAGSNTTGPIFPARYPNGAIYNPAGNTNPALAYGVAVGPTLDGSNLSGSWGGFANGSNMFTAGSTPYSTSTPTDAVNGIYQYIPWSYHINKNNGNATALDYAVDLAGTGDYTDNLILQNGVWAGSNYNYTPTLFSFPVSVNIDGNKMIAAYKIVYADNGQDGYIAALAHNDYTLFPDSAYYPIIFKTTDGGASWSAPKYLDLSVLETLIPALTGTTGNLISTSFELDVAIDANNNLHLITSACAGADGFSIYQGNGASAIFDIYSNDGGNTYQAQLLGVPMVGRGTYGDGSSTNANLTHDNHVQASRSWDGNKMFFTWLDTDTNNLPGVGNTYPDVWAKAYDLSTGLWTTTENKSPGQSTLMFGNASYYTIDNGGTITVPFAYQVISGSTATGEPLNTGGVVDYYYWDGITYTSADFTEAGTPVVIPVVTSINDVEVITTSNLNVAPNPASSVAKISYLLSSSSDVNIKVVNMLGAVVNEMNFSNQPGGLNQTTLDVSTFKSGAYFVTLTAKNSVSTTKFLVK